MEIKILEERTNPLLKRHELRFEVAHATAATPARDAVRTELAKTVHAPKDRVVIERMLPRFGTAVTRGEANVYDSVDAAKSISREHILVRNGLKEKEAKGPAPATSGEPLKAEGAPPAASGAPAEAAATPTPAHHPKHAPAEAPPAAADAGGEPPAGAEPPKKGKAHAKE